MDEFSRSRSAGLPAPPKQPQWGPSGYGGAIVEAPSEKLAFLRKVYALFTGSIVTATVGALVALYAGADMSRATIEIGGAVHHVPPLVLFFANHWIIGAIMFMGAFFGASALRERPGVNVAALFGASFLSGIYIAPMLWLAQLMASQGQTLATSPIRDAFLLAVLGFTGLSSYALISKRDFSFLRGFLSMGIWVIFGALMLSFFVGGTTFSLAISSVGILLFGGYILYDTSRMLRDPTNRDAVGAAIGLYLNFLNLFIFLLRILASSRRDS
jgi:modulator of FtsH protease